MNHPDSDGSATEVHPSTEDALRRRLATALWAVTAAFGCYFCMYAFRKPFTAASFSGDSVWGLSFKTLLVTSQVGGYMLSKFIGVKVISEMRPNRRASTILLLVLLAELALLLFALVPRPWNAWCLFLNGLPLGMVFGLVLGQLEGRRSTEALAAGLCTSFILADGVTKSVGSWLLEMKVPEHWMPCLAGALFLPPLFVCVAMLARVSPPTRSDLSHRSQRQALDRSQRWFLFRSFAIGLVPLIIMYLVVTIIRSMRADFAPELWKGMGVAAPPAIFTQSELYVALLVLAINGGAVLIHDNRLAFRVSLGTCILGMMLLAVALLAWHNDLLSGFAFMVLVGQGLYLPYVAVHTTVFERLLAMTRVRGNSGFLMYLADSIGYLGYVAVMIAKNFATTPADIFGFFVSLCWLCVCVSLLCLLVSWFYFATIRPAEAA
jgi:Family of unknown function (DUF5690)